MRAFPIFFSLFFPWSSRYFSGLSSPLIVLVVLQCDFVFPHAIIIPRSRPYFPGGCQSTFLFRHLNWIETLALNFFFFWDFSLPRHIYVDVSSLLSPSSFFLYLATIDSTTVLLSTFALYYNNKKKGTTTFSSIVHLMIYFDRLVSCSLCSFPLVLINCRQNYWNMFNVPCVA